MAILRVPERQAGSIPQYRRQMVYDTTPGADTSARLSDAAGAIAAQGARENWQPVIATGKAIQQAARVGMDLYKEYNRTRAVEAYNKFQESMTADLYGEDGVFNRRGENARNAVADTEELVRTRAETFAADLSDMGKDFFRQQVGQYSRQLLPQVQRHATHEFNAWQAGTQKTRAELALNDALENYNNPDVFEQRLQESNLALMEMGRINGLSREEVELGVRKNTSAAQLGRANAFLAQDNIADAKAVLAAGLLEGKDKLALENNIRTRQEALEARARAAAKKAEQEAEQAALDAGFSEITGLLKDFPLEQRESEAVLLVNRLEQDPARRRKLMQRVAEEVKWEQGVHEAEVMRGVLQIEEARKASGASYAQALGQIAGRDDISADIKTELTEQYEKAIKADKDTSARNLADLRQSVDERRGQMTEGDMLAAMNLLDMTPADRQKAMDYFRQRGKYGEATQFRFQKAWQAVYGKDSKAEPTDYDIFLSLWPDGAAWDEAAAKDLVLAMKSRGTVAGDRSFFNGTTLRETVTAGTADDFLPDVDSERAPFIDAELRRSISPEAWKRLRQEDRAFLRSLWVREHEHGMGIDEDSAVARRLQEIGNRLRGGR